MVLTGSADKVKGLVYGDSEAVVGHEGDAEPLYGSCTMQVDMGSKGGTTVEPTAFEASPVYERWSGWLDLTTLANMALSDEVTGSLCDTHFQIGKESRSRLASFGRLFLEETHQSPSSKPNPHHQVHEL